MATRTYIMAEIVLCSMQRLEDFLQYFGYEQAPHELIHDLEVWLL